MTCVLTRSPTPLHDVLLVEISNSCLCDTVTKETRVNTRNKQVVNNNACTLRCCVNRCCSNWWIKRRTAALHCCASCMFLLYRTTNSIQMLGYVRVNVLVCLRMCNWPRVRLVACILYPVISVMEIYAIDIV